MKPPTILTINIPNALITALEEFAYQQQMSMNSLTNLLLHIAVRKFGRNSRKKSPTDLLDNYRNSFLKFQHINPNSSDISIAINRSLINKLRLLAGEYDRDAIEVITCFLKLSMGSACEEANRQDRI